MCKKKAVTDKQQQLVTLGRWLASDRKLDFLKFQILHRKAAAFKKAGVCTGGTFGSFKERLVAGKSPPCTVCDQIISEFGITSEAVQALFTGEPISTEIPAEAHPPEEAEDEDLNEYQKALRFLESVGYPIEAVERDRKLFFRCKVCKTPNAPEGKVYTVGKPTLQNAKFHCNRHIGGPRHLTREAEQKEAASQAADPVSLPCQGYRVCRENPHGSLRWYATEFRLYVTHASLASVQGSHEYTATLNTGTWIVRHQECLGNIQVIKGHPAECCKKCQSLGEPRSVQRRVLRFADKYFSAELLSKRLFCREEELEDFIADVSSTQYGTCGTWNQLQDLNNAQLQQFVRKCWKYDVHITNDNSKHFLNSVVEPCLKVNVSSCDSKMASLFTRYADALSGNRLTDAQCVFYFFKDLFEALPTCPQYTFAILCHPYCYPDNS